MFQVNDRVRVSAHYKLFNGLTGTVVQVFPSGDWDYHIKLDDGGSSWGFNEDELELLR